MKSTVTEYDFTQAFIDMNRTENFSYDGRVALYDWLIEHEEDCGTEIELDVIALCCEFTEYENMEDFQNNYGTNYDSIEEIMYNTSVIFIDKPDDWSELSDYDGRFIIANL